MMDWTKLNSEWGYEPSGVQPAGQGTGQPAGQQKSSVTKTPTAATGGGTTVANTANPGNFIYPTEWDNLGDQWSQMAQGNYTNPGMDWLTKLMQSGGGAFDQSGYDAANQPAMMDQWSTGAKDIFEGAGFNRYGSGVLNSVANYGKQLQNQYNKDKWGNAFQGYEAGMGRAYGAGQGLSQFGLGAKEAGLQGRLGLGREKAYLPLYVSNQLNNQEMGWAGLLGQNTGNQNAAPQTYTPSMFQSILQSLSSTLPSAFAGSSGGSFGGNPSQWPRI